jgi:methyl-accepting chemotaxis protein
MGVVAIKNTTHSVSEYVNNIASAIEEQSAVTQKNSSNMQRATQDVLDIVHCISKIAGKRV